MQINEYHISDEEGAIEGAFRRCNIAQTFLLENMSFHINFFR